MRHKGITLLETLIAITIMSIMSGVMALSSATVGQQSARREAERVAAFIQGHINRENIAKRGLWFQVEEDNIQVWHGFSSSSKILLFSIISFINSTRLHSAFCKTISFVSIF